MLITLIVAYSWVCEVALVVLLAWARVTCGFATSLDRRDLQVHPATRATGPNTCTTATPSGTPRTRRCASLRRAVMAAAAPAPPPGDARGV